MSKDILWRSRKTYLQLFSQPDNQLEVVQEAGAINRGINALIKENLDTSFNGHSINSYGLEAALMHRLQIYSKWLVVGAAK